MAGGPVARLVLAERAARVGTIVPVRSWNARLVTVQSSISRFTPLEAIPEMWSTI